MSSPFTNFQDWRRRRLDPDAPEMSEEQAAEFLIEACAQDDERAIGRIFEEAPGWAAADTLKNDESHPIVACMAMGNRRCFNAFLRLSDCALWPMANGRTLAHFALEADAAWALPALLDNGCPLTKHDDTGVSAPALAILLQNQAAIDAFKERAREDGLPHNQLFSISHQALSKALMSAFREERDAGAKRPRPAAPSSEQTLAFLNQRCAWLRDAGLDPDALPFFCGLATEASFAAANSPAELRAPLASAIKRGLSMGCSMEITAPLNSLSDQASALAISAARLSEGLFEELIAHGAQRADLPRPAAEIAWRHLLGASVLLRREGSRMAFLERLSNEDGIWPDFAPDRASAEALFLSLEREKRPARQRALLEAFEISRSAAPGSAGPSAGAPRL